MWNAAPVVGQNGLAKTCWNNARVKFWLQPFSEQMVDMCPQDLDFFGAFPKC